VREQNPRRLTGSLPDKWTGSFAVLPYPLRRPTQTRRDHNVVKEHPLSTLLSTAAVTPLSFELS